MPEVMPDATARIQWREGDLPVSRQFDDPYFSLEGGLDETRHVFLAGNGLPDRFRDGFEIGELGFGTGLNLLATVLAWRAAGCAGRLHVTSFELYPMAADDMARALAVFAELRALIPGLLEGWGGQGRRTVAPGVDFTLIAGDARTTLPVWQGRADAWYLDGFAPARNPQMWEPALMTEVARHTAPGGTAATYSAAGSVRRSLGDAGFDVTRVPGFGRKRHMTRARLA